MASRSGAEWADPAELGRAAAAWARPRRVRVRGRDIRYREAGAGPTVVLVHGLGVSADYWVRNGPVLAARGLRVLAPDLPGFGRTEGPDGGLGVRAQARAVADWCAAVGIERACFVGHSLSCQTAVELSARWPELVQCLVLAAPTGDGPRVPRLVRQAVGLLIDAPLESPTFASLVLHAYVRAGPLRVLRTWLKGAEHDPIGALASVPVPGIVIVGERDPVVRAAFARRLAALLVGGRVVRVPGAHGVIYDRTGHFNEAIVEAALGTHAPSAG